MYKERISTCAHRISEALSIRKMKQADLCRITKIPKSAMSQYLSGVFEPKQDRIYIMAQALNVNEAWLMGYDIPMERQSPMENTSTPDKLELDESEAGLILALRQIPEEKRQIAVRSFLAGLESQE